MVCIAVRGEFLLAATVAAKCRIQWKVNGFTPAFLHNPLKYLGYCRWWLLSLVGKIYSDVDRSLSSVRTFNSSLLMGTFHLLSEPPRFFRVLSMTPLSSKFTSLQVTFLLAPMRHMVFFIKSNWAFWSGVATCKTLTKSKAGGMYFGVSSSGKGGGYLIGLSLIR